MRSSLLAVFVSVRRKQPELWIWATDVIPRFVQRCAQACASDGAKPPAGVRVHPAGFVRHPNGSDAKFEALPGFGLLITKVVPWPQMWVQKAVLLPGSTQ